VSWNRQTGTAWWLDANCRAFGGRPLLLGVLDGEHLVGGVALRITDVGPVHLVRSSMLYNPIVISVGSTQSRQKVLGTLLDDLTRRNLVVPPLTCTTDMVDLRQAVWHHWSVTPSWTVVTTLRTWVLEEDVSRAELKQMRKAQRAEVTASVEPPDADVLYDLIQATMSRQAQEVRLNKEQLRSLIEAIRTYGIQIVVRDVDGAPLSAGLVLAHGRRVAYDVWAGTSTIGRAKGAAVARYICLLKELQARGFEYFDWCGANLPGVSDFKLEFGGTLTTCLEISREPLWFKAAIAAYHYAKSIRGFLKRGGHDQQG
jgi:hypothetical protein